MGHRIDLLRPVRALLAGAALGLAMAILWATSAGDPVSGVLAAMAGTPWEAVTLADLGVGLALAGGWIGWRDGLRRAWPWWLALAGFGNLALLAYVLWQSRPTSTPSPTKAP